MNTPTSLCRPAYPSTKSQLDLHPIALTTTPSSPWLDLNHTFTGPLTRPAATTLEHDGDGTRDDGECMKNSK
eukprot:gene5603-185_t